MGEIVVYVLRTTKRRKLSKKATERVSSKEIREGRTEFAERGAKGNGC